MSTPFNTARALLEAGNVTAARRIAVDAMEATPDNAEVWDLLVDIEMAEKQWQKALDLTKEALARWPDHLGLRLNNALTLMHTRRGTDARKAIEKWEEDFPYRAVEAELLQTIWHIRFGSLKRARYHRRRFEEIAPDSRHVAMLDAMIAEKADDMLGKERASQRMAEDAPMDADAHTRLAFAQFDLFRLGAARRSARAALTMEPTKRQVEGIIWLSWLVLFPPFFVSHLHDWLNGMRLSKLSRGWAAAAKIPMELIYAAIVIWAVVAVSGGWPSTRVWIAFAVLYVAWNFVKIGVPEWCGRRSTRVQDVELKGY